MKAIRYIGTKPKVNKKLLQHRANVTKRRREMWKIETDIENGCYDEQETQVYAKCICPTHPKRSFLQKVKYLIWQLLP